MPYSSPTRKKKGSSTASTYPMQRIPKIKNLMLDEDIGTIEHLNIDPEPDVHKLKSDDDLSESTEVTTAASSANVSRINSLTNISISEASAHKPEIRFPRSPCTKKTITSPRLSRRKSDSSNAADDPSSRTKKDKKIILEDKKCEKGFKKISFLDDVETIDHADIPNKTVQWIDQSEESIPLATFENEENTGPLRLDAKNLHDFTMAMTQKQVKYSTSNLSEEELAKWDDFHDTGSVVDLGTGRRRPNLVIAQVAAEGIEHHDMCTPSNRSRASSVCSFGSLYSTGSKRSNKSARSHRSAKSYGSLYRCSSMDSFGSLYSDDGSLYNPEERKKS